MSLSAKLIHDCTGSSCQVAGGGMRIYRTLKQQQQWIQLSVESNLPRSRILSQVECPLKVMEPVVVSSIYQPLSPSSAKPARSYSSPKGAAAVKMAIKSSTAQKN